MKPKFGVCYSCTEQNASMPSGDSILDHGLFFLSVFPLPADCLMASHAKAEILVSGNCVCGRPESEGDGRSGHAP